MADSEVQQMDLEFDGWCNEA